MFSSFSVKGVRTMFTEKMLGEQDGLHGFHFLIRPRISINSFITA